MNQPKHHIAFSYEFDDLLNAKNEEADLWLRRINFWGACIVLLWITITHRAVPSDQGLMVWGGRNAQPRCVFRLGELAMLYRADWRQVRVIWLQSSRQKAWLHGVRFPSCVHITPANQDELGSPI